MAAPVRSSQPSYEDLLRENRQLKEELARLKKSNTPPPTPTTTTQPAPESETPSPDGQPQHLVPPSAADKEEGRRLSASQIRRYSRQLLVPALGVRGQQALLSSSVLVIGAGGLGSSVLLYLAGAGVGRLGVVDYDQVEVANLHRQVIHQEASQGQPKVTSAWRAIKALNSSIECVTHHVDFNPTNGLSLVGQYDLVVDASDNPRTRYLVNDACVLSGKPLVSGAALGTEGQVTVYHHDGGPCYRCLYPKPLAAEAQRSCSDNGVVGVVPGVIGCLQAMEAIKVLTGAGQALSRRLCLYDGLQGEFHTIRLPPRSAACTVCGPEATITTLQDSQDFSCSHHLRPVEGATAASLALDLPPDNRVTCQDYRVVQQSNVPHLLLDVREPVQFEICSLPGAVNIPLTQLKSQQPQGLIPRDKAVYVVCRRGVLSSHATRLLLDHGYDKVKDIQGGLTEWHRSVDPSFPMY